jgi:hypothetical protein
VNTWSAANPAPRATIADVADHVDHIRKVAGIDSLGIGSDFDGISQTVQDLDNVSAYPLLSAELLRRGYTEADLRKILGLNVLRAMRGAEAVSKRLQKERGPSVAVISSATNGTSLQNQIDDAIDTSNVAALRALLAAGADPKAADEDRVTLVMRAAEIGHAETVRVLLMAGADPTARDRHGRNAADRARDGLASGAPRDFALILTLLTDE